MEFTRTETIRFKHVDYAGIVFYPRFLEMLNDLVEDWFAEMGRPFSSMHEKGFGIPTVDLNVQFKKAARIGDELAKSLWVSTLGGSSVTFGFAFTHADESLCLSGTATLVNVKMNQDRTGISAAPFPDDIRQKIESYKKN
jgi:4-hydroxybenzoyl-CoA thioesterase